MIKRHHALMAFVPSVPDHDLSNEFASDEVTDTFIERFGIDDARALVIAAHQRPTHAEFQTIVIRTHLLTYEAQNALLKILEEPPHSTRLYFVVPVGLQLLPTLHSRVAIVVQEPAEVVVMPAFDEFYSSPLSVRLQEIEVRLKKKDLTWQRDIRQGLFNLLRTDVSSQLADMEFVSRWFLTRGASNKMLLEHLALTLPIRSSGKK